MPKLNEQSERWRNIHHANLLLLLLPGVSFNSLSSTQYYASFLFVLSEMCNCPFSDLKNSKCSKSIKGAAMRRGKPKQISDLFRKGSQWFHFLFDLCNCCWTPLCPAPSSRAASRRLPISWLLPFPVLRCEAFQALSLMHLELGSR